MTIVTTSYKVFLKVGRNASLNNKTKFITKAGTLLYVIKC